jgi:hypothetical protein
MTSKIGSNIIGRGLFQQEPLALLKRQEHSTDSTRCRLLIYGLRFDDKLSLELTMPSTVPPGGRGLCEGLPQALRAWLLSCCPSGTEIVPVRII